MYELDRAGGSQKCGAFKLLSTPPNWQLDSCLPDKDFFLLSEIVSGNSLHMNSSFPSVRVFWVIFPPSSWSVCIYHISLMNMNYGAKKEKLSGQRGVGEGGLELPAERFGDCNLIFFLLAEENV